MRGRAFTLIELLVALAILGLLTAAAVWSFARPLHRARLAEAVAQVKYADAAARDVGRRFGRATELRFDLADGVVERRDGRGVGGGGDAAFRATIASPIQLAAVRTPGREVAYGDAAVAVSALGLSDTYAVKLTGPEGGRWVVFAGLSGESAVVLDTDDAQLDAIFATVSSPRRDAD